MGIVRANCSFNYLGKKRWANGCHLDEASNGSQALKQMIDTFQQNRFGRRVTQFDFARLVCTAYEKSVNVQKAISGFRKARVDPYNKNWFTDLDFVPVFVYINALVTETADIDATEDSVLISNNSAEMDGCELIVKIKNVTEKECNVEIE